MSPMWCREWVLADGSPRLTAAASPNFGEAQPGLHGASRLLGWGRVPAQDVSP